jgi:hypothetical protein
MRANVLRESAKCLLRKASSGFDWNLAKGPCFLTCKEPRRLPAGFSQQMSQGWQPNDYAAVSAASLTLKVSIVGLITSATPGIARTLSNNWLRVDITGLTSPAMTVL